MAVINADIRDTVTGNSFRVVGPEGEALGILSWLQTKAIASERDMDIMLVSAEATPPVVKILDYGRHSYEEKRRKKEQAKKQREAAITVKEIQIRPNTDLNDLQVKARNARRFLDDGDKVKVVVRFRGREVAHRDIGHRQIETFLTLVGDHTVDVPVKSGDRNLMCVIR